MDRLSSVGVLIARILLSSIFLFSGTTKIFGFAQTQAYMSQAGMHMTGLFLVLAILFELGGGLMLLLGFYPRLGALLLILFLLPVTIVFHRNLYVGLQAVQLAKNMAILGGLVAIVSVGGGEFSLCRRNKPAN